jgi:hypothetical protein
VPDLVPCRVASSGAYAGNEHDLVVMAATPKRPGDIEWTFGDLPRMMVARGAANELRSLAP